MNTLVIAGIIIVIVSVVTIFLKSKFFNVQEELRTESDLYYRPHIYTNEVVPAKQNNNLTKTDFKDTLETLLKTINVNGPPGGANTSADQSKYDIVFKDVLVNSLKRNTSKYPYANNYSVDINLSINKIYKAELIEVYVPAATDDTVNIPIYANRLYFKYLTVIGYLYIQAGTYLSPDSLAMELTRQFTIVLTAGGIIVNAGCGVSVCYNKNLNRYIFYDNNPNDPGSLTIYPTNGYVINLDLTVQDSICPFLMLNYSGPTVYSPYISGPKFINFKNGSLYVDIATNYGEANDNPVPTYLDPLFGNSIISGLILTNDKLYLSLGKLNGNTCTIIADQTPDNSIGNVPEIFCQVPNNTCISSASVKTMLSQPNVYSAIQFYNPVINKLNVLDIKWFTDNGKLVRIADHSFTVRIYYYQKRLVGTDFSYQIP
jgi:hypothetical protein